MNDLCEKFYKVKNCFNKILLKLEWFKKIILNRKYSSFLLKEIILKLGILLTLKCCCLNKFTKLFYQVVQYN